MNNLVKKIFKYTFRTFIFERNIRSLNKLKKNPKPVHLHHTASNAWLRIRTNSTALSHPKIQLRQTVCTENGLNAKPLPHTQQLQAGNNINSACPGKSSTISIPTYGGKPRSHPDLPCPPTPVDYGSSARRCRGDKVTLVLAARALSYLIYWEWASCVVRAIEIVAINGVEI